MDESAKACTLRQMMSFNLKRKPPAIVYLELYWRISRFTVLVVVDTKNN